MENPFFSVIVPVHNSAEFMRKCLDSIRDQDFKDYELIVIADKCTDNSAVIAREYTDNVVEVSWGRAGMARNEGLERARGKWILFADDDDWFLHEFAFGMIADRLEDAPEDMDVLAFAFIWKRIGYAYNSEEKLWTAIWNKAWRRSFIGDTRFPDWEHSDDQGWAQELHPKMKVGLWPMPLYYYNYMREGSIQDKLGKGELKPLGGDTDEHDQV